MGSTNALAYLRLGSMVSFASSQTQYRIGERSQIEITGRISASIRGDEDRISLLEESYYMCIIDPIK